MFDFFQFKKRKKYFKFATQYLCGIGTYKLSTFVDKLII